MRVYRSLADAENYLPHDHPFNDWTPLFGEGDLNPDVMIIQKSPTPDDLKGKRPLLGRDGLTIRRALVKQGLTSYVTYAVPFYHPDHKVLKKHGDMCAVLLGNELAKIGGNKILILGADAARWTPAPYSVPFRVFKDVDGRELNNGKNRIRVVPASGAIAGNPNVHTAFLDSLSALVAPQAETLVTLDEDLTKYRPIKNKAQARVALSLAPLGRMALDLETSGLDPYTDKILTVNVSWEEGTGYAFPWELFTPSEWSTWFFGKDLLFLNGQFDIKFLRTHGVRAQMAEDVILMHSLLNETPGTHAMDVLAPKYLGVDKWKEMVDYDNLEAADFRVLGRYGARDADLTLRLANKFSPQVRGRAIHRELHRAQNALIDAEVRGIRIDRAEAQRLSHRLEGMLHDREERLRDEYGIGNPGSPQQVARFLFDELGVPENARPNQQYGRRSTNEKVIGQYKEQFPQIAEILEYRNLGKAKSTYVDALLVFSEKDGRYHPEYKLAATETGRLTEKLITLIPRPTGAEDANEGKKIQQQLRHLFIPDPGHVFVGGDYSQLEVRMVALLSGDKQLIEDVNSNRDMHAINAVTAFNLPVEMEPMATLRKRVEAKWSHERSLAKQATFTYLFGGGEAAIARQLGTTIKTAKSILDALRVRYPRLAEYQKNLVEQVRLDGMVFSLWGRPRHFSYRKGMDPYIEREQDKEAINFPVQSSSTDVNTKAFADLTEMGFSTLFPLHDACYLQARKKEQDRTIEAVERAMQSVLTGPVFFKAEVKAGDSWGQLG